MHKIFKFYIMPNVKLRNLLIMGIDPGTTKGYAVLDLKGNLIRITSSKQLSLNSIIKETISIGKILVVGTDTNPVSSFVEKYSKQIGAKLVFPDNKLSLKSKRRLVDGFLKNSKVFIKIRNKHEKDALASALYAHKRLKSLFIRIDNYLKSINKEELSNEVIERVLLKNIHIKRAAELNRKLF